MDDYKAIKSILKAARKLAKKRNYSEKHFEKRKTDLQSHRTGDRKKLEKAAKKLYEMFDHHIIGVP